MLRLGAGWALAEYRRAGIAYDPPGTRIDRLRETVSALRALFAGEVITTTGANVQLKEHFLVPKPPQRQGLPLLIGGNGDRLLTLAAEQADIVSFTGFSPDRDGQNVRTHFSRSGLAERVAFVRHLSANRSTKPELNVLLQSLVITEDRDFMAQTIARQQGQSVLDVLTCPFLVFGTLQEICLQLTRLRDDLGITYVTVFNQHADDAAKVLAALDQPFL